MIKFSRGGATATTNGFNNRRSSPTLTVVKGQRANDKSNPGSFEPVSTAPKIKAKMKTRMKTPRRKSGHVPAYFLISQIGPPGPPIESSSRISLSHSLPGSLPRARQLCRVGLTATPRRPENPKERLADVSASIKDRPKYSPLSGFIARGSPGDVTPTGNKSRKYTSRRCAGGSQLFPRARARIPIRRVRP